MKIGKKFNTLTHSEYLNLLANYKKFTDFNSLGLFRSLLENTRLSLAQQLEIRDAAVAAFTRSFEFLQVKDPNTYIALSTLGQNLTVADERKAWEDIRQNQQRILTSKRISHRNFGTYSKHKCDYETCHLNGLMIKKGSVFAYGEMHFRTDKNTYNPQVKAEMRKQARKAQKQLIDQHLTDE